MSEEFQLFLEDLRKFSLTDKRIDTGDPKDEADISNFLYAKTKLGKDFLEVTAIREIDSKDDPTKKAGDTFVLKGRLGQCKSDMKKAKSHNPNLSARQQYMANGVLRMCAERNGQYVTRSFKIKNIVKIVMGGDTWIPKN